MADIELEFALKNIDIDEELEIDSFLFNPEIVNSEDLINEDDIAIDFIVEELPHIPKLVFVSDDNISQFVFEEVYFRNKSSSTLTTLPVCCSFCSKKYKNQNFLKIHEEKCRKDMHGETPKLIESEFNTHSENFITRSLKEASEDPMHNITGPGVEVKLLAEEVMQVLSKDTSKLKEFDSLAKAEIFTIIKLNGTMCHNREEMFKKFLHLCYLKKAKDIWNDFLSLSNISTSKKANSLLLQYIFDRLLQWSLEYRVKCINLDVNVKEVYKPLDISEEETIRYIAGYIIYVLKENIKDKRSPQGKALIDLLSLWGSKTEPKDECADINKYTIHWVERVNRGGLIIVNDRFLLFVRQIEIDACKIINKNLLITYCGENLSTLVYNNIIKSELVIEKWEMLTMDLENDSIKNVLYEKIIKRWINIRIRAFVKTWIQIMRRSEIGHKISRKGEVSLRKSLK